MARIMYNFDEQTSAFYPGMTKKTKFAEWLMLPLAGLPESACSVGELLYYKPSVKSIRKVMRSYPRNMTKRDGVTGRFDIDFIPIFSTQKGWRWNRERILWAIDTYPKATLRALDRYLIHDFSQNILRVIFGKHFKAFIRELNSLSVVKDYLRKAKRGVVGYPIFDATPKGGIFYDAAVLWF